MKFVMIAAVCLLLTGCNGLETGIGPLNYGGVPLNGTWNNDGHGQTSCSPAIAGGCTTNWYFPVNNLGLQGQQPHGEDY